MFDLDDWAMRQNKELGRIDGDAADYALGVMYAVGVARLECLPPNELPFQSSQMLRGYEDAKVLIDQTRELGAVPTGNFEQLLEAARQEH